MNHHFHSNPGCPRDQGFHSKQTYGSIYTSDPRDPDVIHTPGSLFFHWNGRQRTGLSGSTKLSVRTYVFIPLRDPDFSKRAGNRSIAYTGSSSSSLIRHPGSRRVTPPIETPSTSRSENGQHPFVIHAPDQVWITWITSFPLERPLPRAIARHLDRSASGCMSPRRGRSPRASAPGRAVRIPGPSPAAAGPACPACHLREGL